MTIILVIVAVILAISIFFILRHEDEKRITRWTENLTIYGNEYRVEYVKYIDWIDDIMIDFKVYPKGERKSVASGSWSATLSSLDLDEKVRTIVEIALDRERRFKELNEEVERRAKNALGK